MSKKKRYTAESKGLAQAQTNYSKTDIKGDGMFKLGIDLGGTKIEGVVLDDHNQQLFRERIATEQEGGYDHILHNIHKLYRKMVAGSNGKPHTFGIGTPGSLSPKTGLLRNSNTQCLNGRPLKTDLERVLRRPAAIQNDANCFAMAEAISGAGAGHDLVFGVIMGTGCGGGIVYKQKVLTGRHAIAGEWGHTSIDPNGPQCWCGNRGCVETFISGSGLEKQYQQKLGVRKSFKDLTADYEQKDPAAVAFMESFFHNFGRAMANLINILDPDIVVLGGGLSNFTSIYSKGVEQIGGFLFCDTFETPIVKNQLGDSAGVIGAALIGI